MLIKNVNAERILIIYSYEKGFQFPLIKQSLNSKFLWYYRWIEMIKATAVLANVYSNISTTRAEVDISGNSPP